MRCTTALILILAFLRSTLAQPGNPGDETFSANRKFSVELPQDQTDRALLTVYRVDGDQKTVLWSKALVADDEMQGLNFYNVHRLLTDDGRFVILRAQQYANDSQPILR